VIDSKPVAFGSWKVKKAERGFPVAVGRSVDIVLLETSLQIASGGSFVGEWPLESVEVGVIGSVVGDLVHGPERMSVELKPTEGQSFWDLFEAVRKRRRSPMSGPILSDSEYLHVADLAGQQPASIVRSYRGKQQNDANTLFQSEAAVLADRGYVPSSQSWAAADRTGALVGALFGGAIGFWGIFVVGGGTAAGIALIITGVLISLLAQAGSPSGGALTVSYARQAVAAAGAPSAASSSAPTTLSDRIIQLDAALAAGHISAEEYATKRSGILEAF
jgi:hypothetical protein